MSWISQLHNIIRTHDVEVIVLGQISMGELHHSARTFAAPGEAILGNNCVTTFMGHPVAPAKVRYRDSLVEVHCRDNYDQAHIMVLR